MARVSLQGQTDSSTGARLRAGLTLVVLVGGLGAAMWWRKPETVAPSSSHLADPAWTPKVPAAHGRAAAPIAGPQPWGPLHADVPRQPSMLFDTPASPLTPNSQSPIAADRAAYPQVSLEWSPEPAAEPSPPAVLKHRVREGETLSSIAYRYFGSRDRYRDIYRANRDRLASPDRVVVGMELAIPLSGDDAPSPVPSAPPRESSPARQVSSAKPVSTGTAVSSGNAVSTAAPSSMVPITAGGWRRSSPERTAQRTYAVRQQDTLSGIALQFYGDARRYLELFEANRHQMRGPDDLHEGMLLVIP